jgi:hypothetical protein
MIMDASITPTERPVSWETTLETAIDWVEGLFDDYSEYITQSMAVRLQAHDLDTVAALFGETKTLDTLRITLQSTQEALLRWVRAHHDDYPFAEESLQQHDQVQREWHDRIQPHLQTPMRAFLCPVLETLSHHAPMKRGELLRAMEPVVRPWLNHRDLEILQNPHVVHWHTTVMQTLIWAEEHQWVTKVVPGYWEITSRGETYLTRQCSDSGHTDPHPLMGGTAPDRRRDLRAT